MANRLKGREINLLRRIKSFLGLDKKINASQEVKDWAISFVVAAVLYFIILPAILGTSSPGVVVASCSERGYLNIGDILIVQGASIKDIRAPMVEVDKFTSFIPIPGDNGEVTQVVIGGSAVSLNRSNDIIVYNAYPAGTQIIHRVFAKIKAGNDYFLLTKGDANLALDQMTQTGDACIDENIGCISTPVTQNRLVGKQVLIPLPLLGHVKLFFCDLTLGKLCDGHSNLGTNYQYSLSC
jgi:signal peptidase I